jgi:hypothetical protein
MKRTTLASLVAVAGLAMPMLAHADTISATLETLNPYAFPTVSLDGQNYTGGVGLIGWQGSSSNEAPFNGAFNTYCIDLIQDIGFGGTYSFTLTPLADAPKSSAFPGGTPTNGMGLAKADEIEELIGSHYNSTLANTQAGADAATAVQLAIWNIIYDTDNSVSTGSGTFYVVSGIDSTAISEANSWLTEAANPANQGLDATNIVALVAANGAQDQLAVTPVPVPSAAIGGSVLLAGYGLVRSRKRAQLVAAELA